MRRLATTAGLFPPVPGEDGPRRAVERQREAGLDRITPGQLDWENLLAHPLCIHGSTDPGPELDHFDSGHTYRQPIVSDELDFDGTLAEELERVAALAGDLQAVVPGPYTLAALAADGCYGDPEEFLTAMENFLIGEIRAFPEIETLLVHEPALVADPPEDGEDARASDAVDSVVRAADCDTVVHLPGGAPTEKVHAHLLDARTDAVGYDFVREPGANLALINEFGTADDVALALVDGRDPTVESSELIHQRVEWFLDNTPPVADFGTIYVTTNSEMRSLPWRVAGRKLDAIGGAVRMDLPD